MKIATWNIERLRHKARMKDIQLICNQLQADILVLTETDEQICPDYKYSFHSAKLSDDERIVYRNTENRVSIYTNYECVRLHETYDPKTALCVELITEHGNLVVYGTIIGIEGNRRKSFQQDLSRQIEDFEQLSVNHSLCICGDFNCSFCDNYYFTERGRDALNQFFARRKITLLTRECEECVDHIAVSEDVIGKAQKQIYEWNLDKRLSDHKGISVTIIP